jgi:OmpA-OmpF porin, OOP family
MIKTGSLQQRCVLAKRSLRGSSPGKNLQQQDHRMKVASLPLVALVALGSVSQTAWAQTGGPAPLPAPAAAPAPAPAPAPAAAPAAVASDPTAALPALADDRAGVAAGGTEEPVSESQAAQAEWAERQQKLGEAASAEGGVGLLYTRHAQGGAQGQFRLQFTMQGSTGGFLCSPEQPCPSPRPGGGTLTEESMDQFGGRISAGATILKWLEVYGMTSAYATSSNASRPNLLQVLGDSTLGAKAFGKLNPWLNLGGGLDILFLNGTGSLGLLGGATSAKFFVAGTADLRGLAKPLPIRISTNLIYSLDNSGELLADVEKARNQAVSRAERYGLRVNRTDHFDLRLGVEGMFLEEKIRPFLEYGYDIPINRQGYACNPRNLSSDGCLATDASGPSRFTLGARFFPWRKGFSLTAAADIGVTQTSGFIEEVAPETPWKLHFGASWAIDTSDAPPVEKVKTVERTVQVVKNRGKVAGTVHEASADGRGAPIPGAIVSWANHPELNALVAGADGRFNTQDLDPGEYTFSIKADGFKAGECKAKVTEQAAPVPIDCTLEALPRVGGLAGRVKDEEGNPVAGAKIKLRSASGKDVEVSTDAQGGYRFGELPPGTATFTVDAEGYLFTTGSADIKTRQDSNTDLVIHKKPKNALVTVGKQEITIKQQVQFELNSAVILSQSNLLLEEIADVIVRTPRIKRIEVQGHTDNSGAADRNRLLSDERANAVRNWLIAHGVTPDRLLAKGYGDSKPIAPNVTAATKARNRRVQFVILDQDPAEKAAPKDAGPKDGGAKPAKKK